jgi:hypothetical protein
MRWRNLAPAAGVFVFALAWLLLLRPYGFQLEDEGSILSWFDRVARGQRPYLDFHTGYTPGFFAFGSAVFAAFGTSATAMRAVLAVMNALSAAGVTEITRRVAGPWLAPLPALVWLAFVPMYVGEFAAFNIPYPTWPVTLAWIALGLALLAWAEKPRAWLLVAAGISAAAAMWFRPNSGAFALAATTWIVAAFSSRQRAIDRAAAIVGTVFMMAGIWYTFEFRIAGMDAFVHLLPALALAVLCGGLLASRLDTRGKPGTAASLAIVAASFLIPTLAWALSLLSALGPDRFLYEVFLVGAGYQTLYYKPHPPPEPFALLVTGAILALAVAGRLVARGWLRPLPLLLLIAVVGGAGKLVLLREGLFPEGIVRSIVAQLENASYWLALVASFGGVALLWRMRADELRGSPRARALVVVAPLAVLMYAQMFPRSDYMHQVTAVLFSAALACALLDRVASWWSRGCWPERWDGQRVVRATVTLAGAGVLAVAFGEKAAGPLAALRDPAPSGSVSERLDVHVERAAGDELEAIAAVVSYLRANTADGEALWSFPATSGLLFAAGRTNLAPHDYWYPGRPDHPEEARVLAMLEQARPRYIVTLNKGWNFFTGAPGYFDSLRTFVIAEYELAGRFGRYDVLGLRDLVTAASIAPVRPATMEDVIEENLERRRQAAWRWMDSLTPADTAKASLPGDARSSVLVMRALRDGGDVRGTAWVELGLASDDARVRSEAVDAKAAIDRNFADARARFAGDFNPQSMTLFVPGRTPGLK